MFRSYGNNNFEIEFENGYTISCSFGRNSRCERLYIPRDYINPIDEDLCHFEVESKNCEVVIIKNNEVVTRKIFEDSGFDMYSKHVMNEAWFINANDVGKIISYLVNLKD